MLIAVVTISSCLQVCRSKLPIHVRRSRQVTWQFIRSFCCIVSRVASAISPTGTSVGCCLLCPSDGTCAPYVWCNSVAKAALHHNTLRASSVRQRMFAKVFVSIIGRWTTRRHTRLHCPLAAVSQSKTYVLLSVCFGSRQTRSCGSTGSAPSTNWSTGGPLWAISSQNKNKQVA